MPSQVINTRADLDGLCRLLGSKKLPITVEWSDRKKRSIEQNRLQRMWMREVADQLGEDTPEGYRGFCKLHFGVPILRAENDEFCRQYDAIIRPLPYEQKLQLMQIPIDFPVTRLMTVRQKKDYLDAVWQHFRGLGVQLTEPNHG